MVVIPTCLVLVYCLDSICINGMWQLGERHEFVEGPKQWCECGGLDGGPWWYWDDLVQPVQGPWGGKFEDAGIVRYVLRT